MGLLFPDHDEERTFDLMLLSATAHELPLYKGAARPLPFITETTFKALRVALLATGPGPVNAALAAGAALERIRAPLILVAGIGGAYAQSGLTMGDLAVASVEIDADTGVEPLVEGRQPKPIAVKDELLAGNRYAPDADTMVALGFAASMVAKTACGPFVTSATVTASAQRAGRLYSLYEPVCENMEGAAVARVALLAGVAFAEIRGISNMVGPRDKSSWRVDKAISSLKAAVGVFLEKLSEERD